MQTAFIFPQEIKFLHALLDFIMHINRFRKKNFFFSTASCKRRIEDTKINDKINIEKTKKCFNKEYKTELFFVDKIQTSMLYYFELNT